jgi:catechol 2,3-dioxygenase-like lactoylglutathione lyase family enzyme
MTFPAPVPEILASDLQRSVRYYAESLGFTVDWVDGETGIAGISRDHCRLFLTNDGFRRYYGSLGPVVIWVNLDSKAQVDELFEEWNSKQAVIVSAPEDKPWMLREFTATDPDGNRIRVFYDFRRDVTPSDDACQ